MIEAAQREKAWSAACQRDYELSVAERAFNLEAAQIEADYVTECAKLKESMLQALLEQRQALLEERDRLSQQQQEQLTEEQLPVTSTTTATAASQIQSTRTTKRTLRSTGGGANSKKQQQQQQSLQPEASQSLGLGGGGGKRRQPAGTSVLGMSTMLPEHEIYEDLNAIARGGEDGLGALGGGRRNAPRTQAHQQQQQQLQQNKSTKRRAVNVAGGSGTMDDLASSPAKVPKKGLKDLSAPADETISADDDADDGDDEDQDHEDEPDQSGQEEDQEDFDEDQDEENAGADKKKGKRKNSAEDKDMTIDVAQQAFYYGGCKYTKGSTFTIAMGRELDKLLAVSLLSTGPDASTITVKKVGSASASSSSSGGGEAGRMKISKNDLLSGTIVILSE